MTILYLLIPGAMLFALGAGLAFLLTIRSGQYDDLDGAAHRILMDDDDPRIPGASPPRKSPRKTSPARAAIQTAPNAPAAVSGDRPTVAEHAEAEAALRRPDVDVAHGGKTGDESPTR